MAEIVDRFGNPLLTRRQELTEEITGPSITGVRSILPTYTTKNLTPETLATALRQAESPGHGGIRQFIELAERMEETYQHYAGVLQTRKLAVCGVPIRVEPADDSADALADAELVEQVLAMDEVQEPLYDVLDAIGKSFSAAEIVWDMSESQWLPSRLEYRLPQWFDFDKVGGKRLMIQSNPDSGNAENAGWEDLKPYKMIIHQYRAKSGLPIRGGMARLTAWAWLFHLFTSKDWIRFIEMYNQPIRVGKYGPSASKEDKNVLWRAVRSIAGDAAAIIPESMLIEFVETTQPSARSDVFKDSLAYLDSQVSINVLGQTLTSEAGDKGARALGEVHDRVRGDILAADCKALARTLRRDLAIPLITLNHGPRKAYPNIIIELERQEDLAVFTESLNKLVPLGLPVSAKPVLERLKLPVPDDAEDLMLSAPAQPDPMEQDDDPDDDAEPDDEDQDNASARSGQCPSCGTTTAAADAGSNDLVAALDAITSKEWHRLTEPLIAPVLARAKSSPETFMADLAEIYPDMTTESLQEQLAKCIFVADVWGRLDDA